jgi:hypothetical protein
MGGNTPELEQKLIELCKKRISRMQNLHTRISQDVVLTSDTPEMQEQ